MNAYLQHGTYPGPFMTERVPVKDDPMTHHRLGVSYTATGYGSKLPTRYKVLYDNRWYRVYSVCFSNVSSEYIICRGDKITVQIVR